MANKDTRKPTMSELITQHEREKAQRLRDSLKRATEKANAEYSNKRQQWLAFYGFPLDQANDANATPSPDDLPADFNDGKGGNDENS